MSHFREVLRTRRKRAGLTQQALAEKAGIDHSYVSKMETEEYYPTRDVALSLAAAFGISGQDKFDFLLEARVASKEDVEELEQIDVEDDKAVKSKQQAGSSLLHSDLLAATATFGSPGSLVGNQAEQLPTFEEQVRQILTSANLPYAKRMIAQQMSLEAIRIICWGLKEAE